MKDVTKEQWVAALRSGKYKQGQSALQQDGKFCCLGVLCDLAEVPHSTGPGRVLYSFADFDSTAMPSHGLVKATGFKGGMGRLAGMNDEGKSFNEIADHIEAHL